MVNGSARAARYQTALDGVWPFRPLAALAAGDWPWLWPFGLWRRVQQSVPALIPVAFLVSAPLLSRRQSVPRGLAGSWRRRWMAPPSRRHKRSWRHKELKRLRRFVG